MSIAIPDGDLPGGGGGSGNCSYAEMEGFQTVVTECSTQGGLFWRVTAPNNVEIDVTDEEITLKNGIITLKVFNNKVQIISDIQSEGDMTHTGNVNIEGDVNITGRLYVNGVQARWI